MIKLFKKMLFLTIPLVTVACSQQTSYSKGVYMLIDTSGTYTKELTQAQRIINFTLAKINPGDTFVVARVDTGSFSEKDIVQKQTFEDRPSMANQQKRLFREGINNFIEEVKPSAYTDITGGMLQAVEYMNEAKSGVKTILIFSDLKEEIQAGYNRDIPINLEGYRVIAINVTKLRSDNIDPVEYLDRLDKWRNKVESGGGEWQVINDLERLEPIFSS